MLTSEKLAEIQERAENAYDGEMKIVTDFETGKLAPPCIVVELGREERLIADFTSHDLTSAEDEQNAELFLHARGDILDLVAEVERLQPPSLHAQVALAEAIAEEQRACISIVDRMIDKTKGRFLYDFSPAEMQEILKAIKNAIIARGED
jgi:hypothetical protein